jgi:hypothetical protein
MTKIRLRKNFLKTKHLHALGRGIFDVRNMGFDHPVTDFDWLHRAVALEPHLNQTTLNFCHD